MKRTFLWLVLILLTSSLVLGATIGSVNPPGAPVGAALLTPQFQPELLRTVTASDTPLTSATKAWSTIKDKFIAVPRGASGVRIYCYADGDGSGTGDPNGGTFSYKVMACEYYGSAKLVATGTWAIGEEALSHHPVSGTALTYGVTDPNSSKWGELPVVTTQPWSGVGTGGTTDDIGELRFDLRGSAGLWIEVTSLSTLTTLRVLAKWW